MEFSYSQTENFEMEKLSSGTGYFKKPVEINRGYGMLVLFQQRELLLNLKHNLKIQIDKPFLCNFHDDMNLIPMNEEEIDNSSKLHLLIRYQSIFF